MEKTQALLYKETDRWQIWLCLLVTLLLFGGAIAFVRGEPAEPVPFLTDIGPNIDVETELAPPPPAMPEETPEATTPPEMRSEFHEDKSTPAPRHSQSRNVTPLVRQTTGSPAVAASLSSARVLALSAPRPEYPYEARRQHLTGSGVAVLLVDPASGAVTNVTIARSTGSAILDSAAISGFRRWRFKPGTVSKVNAPITFTLTGAAY
jgi:TonB family protein